MADLVSSARRFAGRSDTVLRPLPLAAATAGVVSAVSVLLACLAVGIGGWLGSGAAAQGSTADAIRVGADAWLLAQGAQLSLTSAHITAVPLGLSLLCGYVCYRTGRWARASSAAPGVTSGWLAVLVMALAYGVVAAGTAAAAGTDLARPGTAAAFLGGFVLAFLTGGAGLAVDPERPWRTRLPEPVAAVATGALATVLVLVAGSALVLAVGLLRGFGTAANVLSGLHVDPIGALLYTAVTACVTPNAVLLTGSYLLGPGFQVGVGTLVSPTAVSLGPVPAFPLLAALPAERSSSWWDLALLAVPVLAAALAAGLMLRRHPVRRFEIGALQGLAAGLTAGVLFAVLAVVAGGSVGPGRMADVGVGLGRVLPAALLSLGVGGVVGGLLGTWLTRRS